MSAHVRNSMSANQFAPSMREVLYMNGLLGTERSHCMSGKSPQKAPYVDGMYSIAEGTNRKLLGFIKLNWNVEYDGIESPRRWT